MYSFVRFIVLVLSFNIVHNNIVNLGIRDPNSYGPYNLNYTRFDLCSGPKAKNLTEIGFSMSSEGFTFIAHVNLTFFGPTQIEEVSAGKEFSTCDFCNSDEMETV
ncbi:jg3460 [Pararge aegeria aegeria]|uniref:Jg3460 protein n=1 Tax=Pararge aegeria aegeria TaxID=348720 RepID=A0A8S4R8H9_9NEOP|nr:jg3460 [Pararge aegeria aegeria]